MVYNPAGLRRRGAHVVEAAFVYPVLIFIVMALIIGAIGVFYFNQVANLAREGARWASVHGATYASTYNSGTLITGADVYNNAISPKMGGLNPAKLTITVSWSDSTGTAQSTTMSSGAKVSYYDSTNNGSYQGTYYNTGSALQQNMVTVVVAYAWSPPLYLSTINLTSNSSQLMEY